mmetsp:Transcript_50824/g.121502  ORF Transcript_50824/g.121502 Transcript_50824/m.121502 type:complete len:213 (-) Transcript_50824:167-805(-)
MQVTNHHHPFAEIWLRNEDDVLLLVVHADDHGNQPPANLNIGKPSLLKVVPGGFHLPLLQRPFFQKSFVAEVLLAFRSEVILRLLLITKGGPLVVVERVKLVIPLQEVKYSQEDLLLTQSLQVLVELGAVPPAAGDRLAAFLKAHRRDLSRRSVGVGARADAGARFGARFGVFGALRARFGAGFGAAFRPSGGGPARIILVSWANLLWRRWR